MNIAESVYLLKEGYQVQDVYRIVGKLMGRKSNAIKNKLSGLGASLFNPQDEKELGRRLQALIQQGVESGKFKERRVIKLHKKIQRRKLKKHTTPSAGPVAATSAATNGGAEEIPVVIGPILAHPQPVPAPTPPAPAPVRPAQQQQQNGHVLPKERRPRYKVMQY